MFQFKEELKCHSDDLGQLVQVCKASDDHDDDDVNQCESGGSKLCIGIQKVFAVNKQKKKAVGQEKRRIKIQLTCADVEVVGAVQ